MLKIQSLGQIWSMEAHHLLLMLPLGLSWPSWLTPSLKLRAWTRAPYDTCSGRSGMCATCGIHFSQSRICAVHATHYGICFPSWVEFYMQCKSQNRHCTCGIQHLHLCVCGGKSMAQSGPCICPMPVIQLTGPNESDAPPLEYWEAGVLFQSMIKRTINFRSGCGFEF